MRPLRFAAFGAGFWSRFQLAAWRELGGVECVAIYNRTRTKAEALAAQFGVRGVYDDPELLLRQESIDFVDIITDAQSHSPLAQLAARNGKPVICQKPMATSLAEAEEMLAACESAGVPLLIHENWRWQTPIRAVKREVDRQTIGRPFRARISMVSGFPVFKNQPFLKELEQFVLADMGTHLLDVVRFLFGEAERVFCQVQRVHGDIKGEDVATVMLRMRDGMTVTCELGYAENYLERDRFPETYLFVEGDRGSIELAGDYWVHVTTENGTHAKRHAPPRYAWADPAYDVVHASMVPCLQNLRAAIEGNGLAETTGRDNLKTLALVYAAYQSAEIGQSVAVEA